MAFKSWRRRLRHPWSKARAQQRPFLLDITADASSRSGAEVSELLAGAWGPEQRHLFLGLSDREYYCLTEDTLKALLERDGTDAYRWREEGGDCDDFACVLKGRVTEAALLVDARRGVAFGIVHGRFMKDGKRTTMHAMNVAVLADGRCVLVEPQDDSLHALTPESTLVFCLI